VHQALLEHDYRDELPDANAIKGAIATQPEQRRSS
jgi:hypothetical protein